jgi:hypothetical protein
MEYFGSVYRKSVLEAMGSTGVIRPEFREPLDKLAQRLGVSEANTKEIFLEAVEEKMVPMVEWIVSESERTQLTQQQLSQRRKKDMGEDLFQTGKGATVSFSRFVTQQCELVALLTQVFFTGNSWPWSRCKSHERYHEPS